MPQISLLHYKQAKRVAAMRERKFYLLFLALLAYLILYPYIQDGGSEPLIFRLFGVSITVLSVYAVSFRRPVLLITATLAIPTLIQRFFLSRGNESAPALLGIVFTFVFDVVVVVAIFRRVFAKHVPNTETVFGALCIYLLVGFSFGNLYGLLAALQPKTFYLDPALNLHQVPNRFDFIYYSFGTMTCLGTAGITPVSNQARSLSIIEAILGILYLAVLISKLMSAYQDRRN
jgi:hypothetical protein